MGNVKSYTAILLIETQIGEEIGDAFSVDQEMQYPRYIKSFSDFQGFIPAFRQAQSHRIACGSSRRLYVDHADGTGDQCGCQLG